MQLRGFEASDAGCGTRALGDQQLIKQHLRFAGLGGFGSGALLDVNEVRGGCGGEGLVIAMESGCGVDGGCGGA